MSATVQILILTCDVRTTQSNCCGLNGAFFLNSCLRAIKTSKTITVTFVNSISQWKSFEEILILQTKHTFSTLQTNTLHSKGNLLNTFLAIFEFDESRIFIPFSRSTWRWECQALLRHRARWLFRLCFEQFSSLIWTYFCKTLEIVDFFV